MGYFKRTLPGVMLVSGIGAMAYSLAQQDLVRQFGLGSLTLAILIGALFGNALPQLGQSTFRDGLTMVQKRFLRTGVALYGFNLSVQQIIHVGATGVLVDILMVVSTLLAGWFIGTRLLKMDRDLVLLASAGSAICGAAAVLATVPMLKLDDKALAEKSAVAVATVVLFGTMSMFLYPLLYTTWLGAGHFDFGIYVGSTVHEVAQVVAIGSALGENIAHNAVIAKMIRVMLLVPFLLIIGTQLAGRNAEGKRNAIPIPWFALCFMAFAGLNSLQILPEPLVSMLRLTGLLLLTTAMAALGIDTNLQRIGKAGIRPLLLGGGLFIHLVLIGGLFNWLVCAAK
ncbi:MAG: YeiH family protein [Betaproteobacteria bacterium]